MASLPLPSLSPSSLMSHFLPKGSGSPTARPTPASVAADARPSSSTPFPLSSRSTQPSLLPDEPPTPFLPRSLFDPLRSARQPSVARPRIVTPSPLSRSPSDPLSSALGRPSLARPQHATPLPRSLFDPLPSVPRSPSPGQPAPILATPSGPLPLPEAPRSAAPIERTEAALREAGLAGQCWRGDALSASPLPSTPSGFRLLDEALPGGGWPARCLIELLLSRTGTGEIRFLAATLAALTQAGRQIVLLAPPHGPDPTGWEQLGIDMRRVLVVRTDRPADRLWAVEQSLKSSAFGALLAWLPEEKTLARHDVLRRLQSIATAAHGLSFLLRPAAAQFQASPAPLRLTLAAGRPDRNARTLSVRIVKRRGPVLAQPLTLLLPEVHRGMRLFGLGRTPEDRVQALVADTADAGPSAPAPVDCTSTLLA